MTAPENEQRCGARISSDGGQCGLPTKHEGPHTLLIPSSAPWFRPSTVPPLPVAPHVPSVDAMRRAFAETAHVQDEILRNADRNVRAAPVAPASEEEVLRCPFCDGPAEVVTKDGSWLVHCGEGLACYAPHPQMPGWHERRDAVAAWNQRTALTSERTRTRERIGELRRLLTYLPVSAMTDPVTNELKRILDAWKKEIEK